MRKSKRRQTNLISLIIVLVTVACIVALVIALVHQASLEMRFDAIINFLKKIEKAVAGLNTHMEILVCIFALWLAKTQLPLPVSVLSIIAGMVFPLSTALIINLLCSLMFFVIKYEEGKFIGGGWAMMILNIHQARFIKNWCFLRAAAIRIFLPFHVLCPPCPSAWFQSFTAQCIMILSII